MTAEPRSTPNGVARPNPFQHEARQHDNGILVGADVPIAVWRIERVCHIDRSQSPGRSS